MKLAIRKGLSFGLTSGIITTLGLIVGLNSGTHSRLAVIGGIIVIAVADAMSDALGIHMAEESDKKSTRSVWQSTFATFLSKFIFALTFIVPVLLWSLETAIIVSIAWGIALLSVLSYNIAKQRKEKPWHVIFEHVGIALVVIIVTHFLGKLVAVLFA